MHRGRAFAVTLAAACLAATLVPGSAMDGRATRDRPPPGYTGGFSEPTCAECHFDADVNEGSGSLSIEGLPDRYERGATYTLAVTLVQEGLRAGGFQVAARTGSGAQAGAFRAVDSARVDVTTLADVQYVHHLYDGTEPVAPDTARWRIEWTAPDSGETVVLHATANAADDDASPLGDFIYAISVRTRVGK